MIIIFTSICCNRWGGNIYYGKLKGLYCTYPYSTKPDAFQLFIQK